MALPWLMRYQAIPKFTGLMMFPVMLLGPSLVGILLTALVDGRSGLRDLFSRMRRVQVPMRWYAVLLIPPGVMLTVLICLQVIVSPVYKHNMFFVGIAFGCVAGFFEEIGWMGYAFPKMRAKWNGLAASILLGVLWGLWHFPVVDYLGTATPHGAYWLRYFLAFIAAMTAMRVLICWVYTHTGSVLLAQLIHASSTGSLVVLSPAHVTAAQEAFWYAIYAGALWLMVATIVVANGWKGLDVPARRQPG